MVRKKVFMFGDSIFEGYRNSVKDILNNSIDMYFVQENARFTTYVLRYLNDWIRELNICCEDFSGVSFNVGLWDVLHVDGLDSLVSLNEYKRNIRSIISILKHRFRNADILFNLTTPVCESKQKTNFYRKNNEIEKYNEEVMIMAGQLNFYVEDIYTYTKIKLKNEYVDGAHFTNVGYSILGDKIAKSIINVLGEK